MTSEQEATTARIDSLGETRELALKALMTAHRFLDSAENELPGLIERFEQGDPVGAGEPMKQLLQGLGSLTQLAASIDVMLDPQGRAIEGIDLEGLSATLRDLIEAQQSFDWKRVGTVLSSQVLPVLGELRTAFSLRAEALQTSS